MPKILVTSFASSASMIGQGCWKFEIHGDNNHPTQPMVVAYTNRRGACQLIPCVWCDCSLGAATRKCLSCTQQVTVDESTLFLRASPRSAKTGPMRHIDGLTWPVSRKHVCQTQWKDQLGKTFCSKRPGSKKIQTAGKLSRCRDEQCFTQNLEPFRAVASDRKPNHVCTREMASKWKRCLIERVLTLGIFQSLVYV